MFEKNSRTPVPSVPSPVARPALAAGLALILALTMTVPASAAPGGPALVPTAAVANAALSVPKSPQAAQAQQAEVPDLRNAASRDSEIIKDLVYTADGGAQMDQRRPYELSLLDAVEMALRHNLSVQIARYGPQSSFEGIDQSRSPFDPRVTFQLPSSFRRGTSPSISQIAGGDIVTSQSLSGGFAWNETLQWGTQYSLNWNSARSSSNAAINTFNPSLTTSLSGQISQPLLQGFGDVNRTGILVSMNSYDQSLEQFRGSVQGTIAQVVSAYWNLRAAAEQVAVQQESLDLAVQQLERNRIQVEIGTQAPIEMIQAERQEASAQLSLIQAQNTFENAQDALKELINFDAIVDDPFAYDLIANEEPEQTVDPIDVEQAVQVALENDPTLASQRIGLRTAELNLRQARNSLLPNLSVNASFNLQGRGGNRLIRGGDFGGDVIEVIEAGYTTALAQLLSGDFNTWSIGASLSFPIYNRSAKAGVARSEISQRQQLTQFEQRRQQVTYDVRQQARQVQNLVEQVATATNEANLAQRQLDAEQRKFEVGTSTNFQVLNFQNQLTQSQIRLLNAVLNLQGAIIQLELTKGTLLEYFGVRLGDAGVGGSPSPTPLPSSPNR